MLVRSAKIFFYGPSPPPVSCSQGGSHFVQFACGITQEAKGWKKEYLPGGTRRTLLCLSEYSLTYVTIVPGLTSSAYIGLIGKAVLSQFLERPNRLAGMQRRAACCAGAKFPPRLSSRSISISQAPCLKSYLVESLSYDIWQACGCCQPQSVLVGGTKIPDGHAGGAQDATVARRTYAYARDAPCTCST